MKRILFLCASVVLLFACKKNKDNNNSSPSTWTFNGTSYTAASVTYLTSGNAANLDASAQGNTVTSQNGLVFAFATIPTASGQMLITNTNAPNTVLAGIAVVSNGTNSFYSNDSTNVYANITMHNGKISVSFPGTIWLHNSTNHADSAQLSVGTITQN